MEGARRCLKSIGSLLNVGGVASAGYKKRGSGVRKGSRKKNWLGERLRKRIKRRKKRKQTILREIKYKINSQEMAKDEGEECSRKEDDDSSFENGNNYEGECLNAMIVAWLT